MIVAEHLTKYYDDKAAVADVSFTIQKGEVVGLLGLNGAGKTTLLRMLSGLILPTSGSVSMGGVSLLKEPDLLRAKIGFLPENPPVYPEMTVASYLTFVARIKGVTTDLQAKVEHALAVTDLQGVREQRIGTLSHGYTRRVGIAQAVVHRPELVLLDEPTSGLDPVQIVHMRDLIKSLAGTQTLLVSSHILSEIHQLCDRILVVKNGRIVAEGSEQELSDKVGATSAVAVELKGTPAALRDVLANVPAVTKHRIEREGDGIIAATIELHQDVREELAAALVRAGLGLRRFERVQLELESIFLELTGRDQHEVQK